MNKNIYILSGYVFLSFLFYIYVAEPALNGLIELRVWADAPVYEAAADNYEDISDLVTVAGNLIGPVLTVRLLDNNYFYIYLFNCLIFIVSCSLLLRASKVYNSKILIYLVMNPMLFISLFSVNKEILSLLFIALLISYVKNKKISYVVLCFFSSLVVRWQLTLFLLVYLILTSPFLKMNVNRFKALFIFILGISAVYILASQEIQVLLDASDFYADLDVQGSGFFSLLNDIQAKYGYFIVFIPKIFQNLFGGVTRISTLFDWSDFYNNFIVSLQCLYLSATAILIAIKRKINMYNDIFHLSVIYCVFFAVTPIVQNRYFFPVSIMFAVLLSDDHENEISYSNRTIA